VSGATAGQADDVEIPVRLVQLLMCDPCIDGEGDECHTPGCALWIHDVPKPSLRAMVTIIDAAPDPGIAQEPHAEPDWHAAFARLRHSVGVVVGRDIAAGLIADALSPGCDDTGDDCPVHGEPKAAPEQAAETPEQAWERRTQAAGTAPELAAGVRETRLMRERLDAVRELCEARIRVVGMVDGKGVARKVIAIIDKLEGK
jgi:hypothetical protein